MITSMNHHPIPLFSLRTCLTAWAALLLGASVLSASEVWRLDRTDNTGEHAIQMIGSPQVVTEGGVKAVAFDGARDGLLVPVNPLAGLDAFTIEVLLAPAAGGLAEQRVVHIQDGSSIDTRVMLETRLTPEGKWCVDTALLAGENKCVLIDRTKLHPSRQWAWVALRYDGKTMAHFVDGVKEMEGSVAFPRMKPGQTSLGVRQNLVSWYKGEIREVRFHPAALADGKLARVGSASAAAAEAKPPKPNMGGQPQTRTPH